MGGPNTEIIRLENTTDFIKIQFRAKKWWGWSN